MRAGLSISTNGGPRRDLTVFVRLYFDGRGDVSYDQNLFKVVLDGETIFSVDTPGMHM